MKDNTSNIDRVMQIRLQNVGIVTEAKVALSGITVIAGPNKSGKSTIGRALMAYGTLLRRMDELVHNRRLTLFAEQLGEQTGLSEFYKTRLNRMFEYNDLSDDVLSLDFWNDKEKVARIATMIFSRPSSRLFRSIQQESVNELIEKFSKLELSGISKILDNIMGQNENALIRDIMDIHFRKVFVEQINSLYSPENEARIEFLGNVFKTEESWIRFINNHLIENSNNINFQFPKILYLEPMHLLDFACNLFYRYNDRWSNIIDDDDDCSWENIMQPTFAPKEDISLEDKQDIEKLIVEIKSILGGELDVKDGRLQFKESSFPTQAKGVELENLASGMKSMTAILKALDCCVLRHGRILVIDEPESNLHPEWQVKFAFVLVHLWTMLGVRVVVATHSPYFLKGLENSAAQLNCLDNMSCYFMQSDNDGKGMVAKDVTNRLNEVYKSFFDPLNNLMAGNGRES